MKTFLPQFRMPFSLLALFIFYSNIVNGNETNVTGKKINAIFSPSSPTGGVSKLDIKLFQATAEVLGIQADGVVARYNGIYQESPYETYDVAKLDNLSENLSLVRSDRYLSIESRPFPTKQDTLHLSFWGLKSRDYALTITSSQFTGISQMAILTDAFASTQTAIDLNSGAITYLFTITSDPASSSFNRFKIVMAPITVLPVNFLKINTGLSNNKVQISWANSSELGIRNYTAERSADGTSFSKIGEVTAMNAANGASYQWMDNRPLPGKSYYRIRSNHADGKYAYSSIATVQLNRKKGIQVMPTVIVNKRFNLVLNDQAAGNYQLTITNAGGQQVYQKKIENIGGSNTQVIEMGINPMPTGVYNLFVIGLNGSNQNLRLFIQN